MSPQEPYTCAELDHLVDYLLLVGPQDGFIQYRINGQYVSAAVVEQALLERLEKMAQ